MRRHSMVIVSAVVITLGVIVATAIRSSPAVAEDPPVLALQSNYTVSEAQAFDRYPIYYAGDTFAGLSLSSVWKEAISAPAGTTISDKLAQAGSADVSTIQFTYGSCVIPASVDSDECSIPVVVQMWPACARNPSLYQTQTGLEPPSEPTTVRGVPATFFEDGVRLEIQTSTATIVIFDHRVPTNAVGVANALERLNGPGIPIPGQPFPQPTPEAMNGTLAC